MAGIANDEIGNELDQSNVGVDQSNVGASGDADPVQNVVIELLKSVQRKTTFVKAFQFGSKYS